MIPRIERSAMLFGEDAVKALAKARVCVVGLGGVGSYAAESIVRAGVGHITLVDCDTVSESNLNRQLIALHSTVGLSKTKVCAARARDIAPDSEITPLELRYSPETTETLFSQRFDYIIDAIDTVTAKASLIYESKMRGMPVISALGTGNKTDPCLLEFADIYSTSVCPLARAMRRELRKLGVARHTVLYSTEAPKGGVVTQNGRHAPGSCSWLPGCAGLMLAGRVVTELISADKGNR